MQAKLATNNTENNASNANTSARSLSDRVRSEKIGESCKKRERKFSLSSSCCVLCIELSSGRSSIECCLLVPLFEFSTFKSANFFSAIVGSSILLGSEEFLGPKSSVASLLASVVITAEVGVVSEPVGGASVAASSFPDSGFEVTEGSTTESDSRSTLGCRSAVVVIVGAKVVVVGAFVVVVVVVVISFKVVFGNSVWLVVGVTVVVDIAVVVVVGVVVVVVVEFGAGLSSSSSLQGFFARSSNSQTPTRNLLFMQESAIFDSRFANEFSCKSASDKTKNLSLLNTKTELLLSSRKTAST